MFSQRFFEFFKKETKSYKEKCGTVKKIKQCKKRYHKKKSATKVFEVCISIVYDSFSLSPIA